MKKFVCLALVLGTLGSGRALAGGMTPAPVSADFDAVKSLAGSWTATGLMDGKPGTFKMQYKVTSAGHAVEETIMQGGPSEMVSVYFMDGPQLMMTHYCALGNQPRMKLTESKQGKLKFTMVDATGMKSPQDPHMGALTLTIKDKDHFTQEWVHFLPNGKQEPVVFTYSRDK